MKSIPYISIIFLTVLYSMILYNSSLRPKPYGDGEYYEGAKTIVSGQYKNLEIQKGLVSVLYYVSPIFISGLEKDNHTHFIYAIIWNQIINIISLSIIFFATKKRYGYKAGILVLIFSFLLPIHIYYGMGIIAEPAAYFFVSIAFLGWSNCFLTKRINKYTILLIIALSLLLNVRQNYQALIVILFILSLLSLFVDNIKPFCIKYWTLFVTVALLSLSLNLLTNKVDMNRGQFKSLVIKNSLILGRYQLRDEPFNWTFWDDKIRKGSVDYKHCTDTLLYFKEKCGENFQNCNQIVFFRWLSEDILNNKLLTLRQCFAKILQTYSFYSSGMLHSGLTVNFKFIIFHVLINIVNYSLLTLFILFLINNRSYIINYWIFWGMVIAPYVWIFALFSESRYIFPARPLIFIGAAVFLSTNHNKIFEKISKNIYFK